MKAVNIKWDTDGDNELLNTLPKEMDVPEGLTDDGISDYISDTTGFCHHGYVLEDNPIKQKGKNMAVSNEFKEGYCDGHGQAIENVRYNLIEYIKENGSISIDKVNEICDFCAKVDEDYLDQ